jgi:hypothetical protein
MIQQSVMPFKLKRTEERITARSGLALYAEWVKAMDVEALVTQYLPKPGSGHGYKAISYVGPISATLYGGGETISDAREIREDNTLREVIGLKSIPSSSAIGDWLKRMGEKGGILGMEKVNEAITKKVLKQDKKEGYTLIIDPTLIEAEKREAQMTYLGFKGYRPVVATLKENGLVIAYQFKEGNDNGGRVEIIKRAVLNMPYGKKIEEVLLDSEYYTAEVIDYLTEKGLKWAIAADKDASVLRAIEAIEEGGWKPYKTSFGDTTDREVAETVHTMNKGGVAFRLIILRWKTNQMSLFKDTYSYHCIATGMIDEIPEEVVWRYNHRAQIENHIKEIKGGFGMERLPSGDLRANAVYFGIGIMTYNLFIAQKMLMLPLEWQGKTIKSIRWLLVEVAGKLIKHGRCVILKIAVGMEKYKRYAQMRQRIYELSLK